mmetsp:Transcript_23334/g.81327  ORF Transcript_23334/g.81327 Transcript_23334/m.81327 type:complete len:735 (-) Transcript_23334:330-2534(-)
MNPAVSVLRPRLSFTPRHARVRRAQHAAIRAASSNRTPTRGVAASRHGAPPLDGRRLGPAAPTRERRRRLRRVAPLHRDLGMEHGLLHAHVLRDRLGRRHRRRPRALLHGGMAGGPGRARGSTRRCLSGRRPRTPPTTDRSARAVRRRRRHLRLVVGARDRLRPLATRGGAEAVLPRARRALLLQLGGAALRRREVVVRAVRAVRAVAHRRAAGAVQVVQQVLVFRLWLASPPRDRARRAARAAARTGLRLGSVLLCLFLLLQLAHGRRGSSSALPSARAVLQRRNCRFSHVGPQQLRDSDGVAASGGPAARARLAAGAGSFVLQVVALLQHGRVRLVGQLHLAVRHALQVFADVQHIAHERVGALLGRHQVRHVVADPAVALDREALGREPDGGHAGLVPGERLGHAVLAPLHCLLPERGAADGLAQVGLEAERRHQERRHAAVQLQEPVGRQDFHLVHLDGDLLRVLHDVVLQRDLALRVAVDFLHDRRQLLQLDVAARVQVVHTEEPQLQLALVERRDVPHALQELREGDGALCVEVHDSKRAHREGRPLHACVVDEPLQLQPIGPRRGAALNGARACHLLRRAARTSPLCLAAAPPVLLLLLLLRLLRVREDVVIVRTLAARPGLARLLRLQVLARLRPVLVHDLVPRAQQLVVLGLPQPERHDLRLVLGRVHVGHRVGLRPHLGLGGAQGAPHGGVADAPGCRLRAPRRAQCARWHAGSRGGVTPGPVR